MRTSLSRRSRRSLDLQTGDEPSGREPRRRLHRWALASALTVGLGSLAGIGTAFGASGGESGLAVTVNGKPMPGEGNTLLPGCTMEIGVTGFSPGSHTVDVAVTAMGPSGSGTVLSVSEAEVSGTFTTGPRNLAGVLFDGGWVKAANGYHLRTTVIVDGAQVGSAPYWLACGAVQHVGHSVQVVFSVQWKDRAGKVTSEPPRGLPISFRIAASSNQGTGTCLYAATDHLLHCTYVVTTEEGSSDEGSGTPPAGLRVSGLGTYTVEEVGLPANWRPDLTTVGQFAADPGLRQWMGGGDDSSAESLALRALPHAGGPPTTPHVIVNIERP